MAGACLRHEVGDQSIILVSFRIFLEYDVGVWRGLQRFLRTLRQRSRAVGCNWARTASSLYALLSSSGVRRVEARYLLMILRLRRVLCDLESKSGAIYIVQTV